MIWGTVLNILFIEYCSPRNSSSLHTWHTVLFHRFPNYGGYYGSDFVNFEFCSKFNTRILPPVYIWKARFLQNTVGNKARTENSDLAAAVLL